MKSSPIMPSLRIEQLAMHTAGILLLSSGLIHTLVWLSLGGSLEGDISWRKPILFGFSTGATMLSLGWVTGQLARRKGDALLLSGFSIVMLTEVFLITLQQWRGVPSHFNRATPLDATILFWIEGLIVFATIVIAYLTWRCFGKLAGSDAIRLSIRSGMAMLLFACLLGFLIVAIGNQQLQSGKNPGVFGAAGVMKFPHGMPIHAIQYFPLLVWILHKFGVAPASRLRTVKFAVASVSLFTVYSLLQTFTGRARFDVTLLSGAILAASIALLCIPAWTICCAIFRQLLPSPVANLTSRQ